MSENSYSFNNGRQMQVNTSLAKLFPWEKEFVFYSMNNSTYVDMVVQAGTVIGIVSGVGASNGFAKPLVSTASDGSQNAQGILGEDFTIPAGDTFTVPVMVRGEVRSDMVLFYNGTDTLSTPIGGKRIFEHLLNAGVFPRGVRNATNYDNSLS